MTRGRPPLGPKIVRHLDGEADSKRRLEILLQTIAGSLSVPQACEQLGLSEARFFQLRSQILQGALDSMQPRPAGRPARTVEPKDQRIEQLQREVQLLHVELTAAQIREEIALAMPHLLRPRDLKKTPRLAQRPTQRSVNDPPPTLLDSQRSGDRNSDT